MKKSTHYLGVVLISGFSLMSCSEREEKNQVTSDVVNNKPKMLQSTLKNQAISDNKKANKFEENLHPSVFLKKTVLKIKELVGKPDFTRKEGQALVLQYQSDLCILDIFFYGTNETKISTYFEFRPRNNIKINVQKCMNTMLTKEK
jgi:hypothetical protein